ncbi:hypothetical protein L596_015511 [Steinernema carpocapsae]|uniref:Uncharacterized protein n=1 Tax=Steinernema carpocapsae TaxID=34508 RepID=A0A4U5NFD2_STECR|nr:hypothetical protein L596_015511 [Steinernema carpocapsae]
MTTTGRANSASGGLRAKGVKNCQKKQREEERSEATVWYNANDKSVASKRDSEVAKKREKDCEGEFRDVPVTSPRSNPARSQCSTRSKDNLRVKPTKIAKMKPSRSRRRSKLRSCFEWLLLFLSPLASPPHEQEPLRFAFDGSQFGVDSVRHSWVFPLGLSE